MASFMTLGAYCESCETTIDVYVDELFEFDCTCKDCGGLLVLQEDESDADSLNTTEFNSLTADRPTKSDSEGEADELFELQDSGQDEVPVDSDTTISGDRPTKADTLDDDPYAVAAMALDPSGSDRIRRSEIEIVSASALTGTPADSPPLPSWDGGDTQQVKELASSEPQSRKELGPLDMGDELPVLPEGDPGGLGDLVEVVEVTTGTAGRGSRTYDAEPAIHDEPPAAELPALPPRPAEDEQTPAKGLFGDDLDWLALIDDRLQECDSEEGGDESGRVIIRLPEEAAPGSVGDSAQMAQLQQTMEHLESGGPASLGALIQDGFGRYWSILLEML